jgi:ABC-type polysaccharide/polyol phosphate transport system ATPase subunit
MTSAGENLSDSDVLIDVRNVSKCYHLYDRPQDRLFQSLFRGRKKFHRDFWALKDVSLEVKKGETVGVIGRNGAGKSTLLQLIAETLTPTQGSVRVHGRIAALLQLGSGFNPEFAGRENVYLNGAVLGLSRAEIDRRFGEILDFAEIGEFIDQPIKTYSSGMVVRLAFAVSVCLEPDILIVDEALSVGDMLFQLKCFARLKKLKENGTSILFVSHDLSTVRSFCDRAIYLKKGEVAASGNVNDVVKLYEFDCYQEKAISIPAPPDTRGSSASKGEVGEIFPTAQVAMDDEFLGSEHSFSELSKLGKRQGTQRLSVIACFLAGAEGSVKETFLPDEEVTLNMLVSAAADYRGDFHASVQINEKNGAQVAVLRDSWFSKTISLQKGERLRVSMKFRPMLRQGDYYGTLGILCFPAGRKYVNGVFNLQELELSDHVEIGVVFNIQPMIRHPIAVPVLIESALNISSLRVGDPSALGGA